MAKKKRTSKKHVSKRAKHKKQATPKPHAPKNVSKPNAPKTDTKWSFGEFFSIILAIILWIVILELEESVQIKIALTTVLLILVGIRVYRLLKKKLH